MVTSYKYSEAAEFSAESVKLSIRTLYRSRSIGRNRAGVVCFQIAVILPTRFSQPRCESAEFCPAYYCAI